MRLFNNLTIYLILGIGVAFSQRNNQVRKSLDSLSKTNIKFAQLSKIQEADLNGLEDVDYSTIRIFAIDLNKDEINDLAVILDIDYKKMVRRNPENPSKNKYRFLLLCEGNKKDQFILTHKITKALNQHTEGVSHQDFVLLSTKEGFVLREFGEQMATGWATDLEFVSRNNSFLLKHAVVYSANISFKGAVLSKVISKKIIDKTVIIDSTNYYNYFPFGFTDDISDSKNSDPKITITTPKSFFYQDASEAKPKKSFLLKGDIAFVEETKGDWLFIRFEGKTITRGWMHKKNVKFLK